MNAFNLEKFVNFYSSKGPRTLQFLFSKMLQILNKKFQRESAAEEVSFE